MPTPQPPLILVDNVFDRISLYPLASLAPSAGSVVGREINYIADYRRERSYYQFSAAFTNSGPIVDLGAGNTAVVDSCWIDRGHNLWGKTIYIDGSADAITWGGANRGPFVVPAQGTVGGDPTAGWSVTEEGAIYQHWTNALGYRYWRLYIVESTQAIIPGIIMGKKFQLLNFSSVRDEDAGERSNRVEKSLVPGYDGRDRQYARRTINLKLSTIGATEYDSSIRSLRRLLFEVDQPAVVVHNYGTNPKRAWLYQYEGANWSSPMTRVLRDLGLPLSEVGPVIR
jgi:hypothetical protein